MNNKKRSMSDKLSAIDIGKPKTGYDKLFSQKREGTTGLENAFLIDISLITPNPNQPRKSFKQETLSELAESIKERGILQPIRVRAVKLMPKGEMFEIIAGERRWQAAKIAGLQEMPCILADQTESEAYIDSLIENIQREDLNAIDKANGISELRVNLGLHSWDDVAQKLGITRQHIHNLLGLKKLPDYVQQDIINGELTEKHGRALKKIINNKPAFQELYQKIKTEKLTGDETLNCTTELVQQQENKNNLFISTIQNNSNKFQKTLQTVTKQNLNDSQRQNLLQLLSELNTAVSKIIEKLN